MPKGRVAVGMSGGVDSTMAAHLLKREGYEVIGLTMQIWDGSVELPDTGRSACYGPGEANDLASARIWSQHLDIPHTVIPLVEEYEQEVLGYFREEYLRGRTPNPCVRCNLRMKFGAMLEKARLQEIAFDYFATGHYVRVDRDPASGRYRLLRGLDPVKDQSYFLSYLTQAQLAQAIFPLGALTKEEVKALAREIGCSQLADQRESQDFLEADDYAVLFKEQEIRPGPIVDREGTVLGEHKGIVHYTVGQRRGLGIGGAKEPLYVVDIDGPGNAITVGRHGDLFCDGLRAEAVNWIGVEGLGDTPLRVQAKVRQQHTPAPAVLTRVAGEGGSVVSVTFDEPQMSITPGQAVVFYQDDVVIGGGTIEPA